MEGMIHLAGSPARVRRRVRNASSPMGEAAGICGEAAQAVAGFGFDLVPGEPPRPVAAGNAGHIHAGGRVEAEDILERAEGGGGRGVPDFGDEIPMDF